MDKIQSIAVLRKQTILKSVEENLNFDQLLNLSIKLSLSKKKNYMSYKSYGNYCVKASLSPTPPYELLTTAILGIK